MASLECSGVQAPRALPPLHLHPRGGVLNRVIHDPGRPDVGQDEGGLFLDLIRAAHRVNDGADMHIT